MKPIAILMTISLVVGTAYAQTDHARDSDKKVIATILGKEDHGQRRG